MLDSGHSKEPYRWDFPLNFSLVRSWRSSCNGLSLRLGLLGRPLGYLIFSLMALIRDPIY